MQDRENENRQDVEYARLFLLNSQTLPPLNANPYGKPVDRVEDH
jgi:hypothetical protein